MQSDIHISNRADTCVIEIEGVIGVPETWQFDDPAVRVATYDKFRETVRRIGGIDAREVEVEIRSTGGDVNDALLIYDALRSLPARIVTRCYGYTASAATIIAQAASEGCREISPNALYLIHNAVCAAEGNAEELAAKLDMLRQTDRRIAGVYAFRSGRDAAEFAALMGENSGNGRWLSPEEAVAAGLADRIAGEGAAGAAASPVQSLVRGWERLLVRAGLRRPDGPPEDRNVLHFDDGERARREAAAAESARAAAGPTTVKPCEDPSPGDPVRQTNAQAYADDARRFGRG